MSQTTVKYPQVTVQLSEQDGNAFMIMGRVGDALKRAGVSQAERHAFFAEATSGDYVHVLQTVMRWVETA